MRSLRFFLCWLLIAATATSTAPNGLSLRSAALVGVIAPAGGVPANIVLQWDTGSADALVTTTNLGANTHDAGAPGAWSYSEARTPTHTRVTSTTLSLPFALSCAGQSFTGGTKCLRFDITERLADVDTWDGLEYSIPAGVSDLALLAAVKIDTLPGASDSKYDLLQILSDKFAIGQVGQTTGGTKEFNSHGQTAGGSTAGPRQPYTSATQYTCLLVHSQTDQVSAFIVLDVDGVFLAASDCDMDSASDVTLTQFTDYLLPTGNGTVKLGTVGWFWGANYASVLARVSVPAVTSLTALQTDVGEVTVSFDSPAMRWKVERSANAGSTWSTLAASFRSDRDDVTDTVEAYVDATAADGATYIYRVTANVLGRTAPATTSASVTIDDSAFDTASSPTGVTRGLIGQWKFDEGAGATAADVSGNSLTGSISGADWVTGHLSGALQFVAANDDYVQVADNALLDLSTTWTIHCFVKLTSVSVSNNVASWFVGRDTDTGRSYDFGSIGNGSSAVLAVQINGTTYAATGSPTDLATLTGVWHHMCVTYTGSALAFYIDGVLDGTSTGETPANTATPLRFGARAYPGFHGTLNGAMDNVKIHNVVLTSGEIISEAAQ